MNEASWPKLPIHGTRRPTNIVIIYKYIYYCHNECSPKGTTKIFPDDREIMYIYIPIHLCVFTAFIGVCTIVGTLYSRKVNVFVDGQVQNVFKIQFPCVYNIR